MLIFEQFCNLLSQLAEVWPLVHITRPAFLIIILHYDKADNSTKLNKGGHLYDEVEVGMTMSRSLQPEVNM